MVETRDMKFLESVKMAMDLTAKANAHGERPCKGGISDCVGVA